MNKLLKNKRTYLFSFLVSILIITAISPSIHVKAALKVGDLPITGATVSLDGTLDTGIYTAPTFYKLGIGLEQVTYNDSIDDLPLGVESFAEADIASKDLKTDGITHTYSDSYTTLITGISSGVGLYQTLRTIPESDFTQYATKVDSSVYSYTTTEAIAKTVNDTINAEYPTCYYDNLTVSKMYLTIVFDRVLMDAFFASAKAKAGYTEVATDYSTNKEQIVILLNNIFSDYIHDIVYAPVDTTDWATTWSVQKEVRSVLGGNASDTSFNNASKISSMRNLMIGFIGWKVAPTTTVNTQLEAKDNGLTGDVIYGFEATATTYSIKLNILSDFTGSGLTWGMELDLSIFGDSVEVSPAITSTIYWFIVIGTGVGVFLAVIALSVVFSKNKDKLKQHALVGLILGILTSIILFLCLWIPSLTVTT